MKRKITLLLLAASSVLTMKSQVVLSEDFTSPFNATSSGWYIQNLSTPTGTDTWMQGVGSLFPAYNGNANDYFFNDFSSAGTPTPAGISNWLMTPTITIYNGAILQFATKSLNGDASFNPVPDRMQVRMSTSGTASTIAGPTSSASIGSFTELLLDINPALSTATVSSPISNSVVANYPSNWTVYQIPITGVTGTLTGRFAFRYFVNDAGPQGLNSLAIGVDAVRYILPCGTSVQSFTTCANQPVVLTADGGLPSTTYSWAGPGGPAGSTQSITVTAPASGTAVYTLTPSNGTVSCGVSQTATVTVSSALSMNVAASQTTVCDGTPVTLTASSSATSYTWLPGSNAHTSVITVTPNVTTTYTVAGTSGSLPNICAGANTITIHVNANPTLSIAYSNPDFCSNGTLNVTASGASTYTFFFSSFTTTNNPLVIPMGTVTADTPIQYGILGTAPNGCVDGGLATFTIFAQPVVTIVPSRTIACRNTTVTLTGGGADTYTWTGTGITTSTTNPLAYGTGSAVAGTRTVSLIGMDATTGCTNTAAFSLSVTPCNGIESISGNSEASVFPNPFTNELKVSGLTGTVEVYNALGQVVIKATVAHDEAINTNDLTKGVYILKAYNTGGELTKTIKLLKN